MIKLCLHNLNNNRWQFKYWVNVINLNHKINRINCKKWGKKQRYKIEAHVDRHFASLCVCVWPRSKTKVYEWNRTKSQTRAPGLWGPVRFEYKKRWLVLCSVCVFIPARHHLGKQPPPPPPPTFQMKFHTVIQRVILLIHKNSLMCDGCSFCAGFLASTCGLHHHRL